MSSPRPSLEWAVAPEEPRSMCTSSGRTRCREGLQATRDRRRASPRSAHSASPRTLRKSKPGSRSSVRIGSVYAAQERFRKMFFAIRCHHLLKTFWNGAGRLAATDNYPTAPSSGPARPATPTSPTPPACTCSRTLCEPTATSWTGDPPTTETHRRPRGDDAQTPPHPRGTTPPKPKPPNANSTTRYVAERNKPPPF